MLPPNLAALLRNPILLLLLAVVYFHLEYLFV
jgi:hypothetical protein